MTKNTEQDIAFIRALADLMSEGDLTEIEVSREYGEDDELKVRLSRLQPAQPIAAPAPVTAAYQPPAGPPAGPVPAAAEAGHDPAATLFSPMVGTAYLSPEPGATHFVQVGDTVTEGQTVLIIEAMKTMNQIPSPHAGTVRAILVSNAEPVEYGAPLMIIS